MNGWRRLRVGRLVRMLGHANARVRWRWAAEGLAVNGSSGRSWRVKFGNGLWVRKEEKGGGKA
jgi:hypothetical protein